MYGFAEFIFSSRISDFHDGFTLWVSGATEKTAKPSTLNQHGPTACAAECVRNFRFPRLDNTCLIFFHLYDVLAFWVSGATQKWAEFASFDCHRTAAFLARSICFHLLVFCWYDLTIVSTGKILGILACWIIGAGDELSVFPPLYDHGTSAFFTDFICWRFFYLDISHG